MPLLIGKGEWGDNGGRPLLLSPWWGGSDAALWGELLLIVGFSEYVLGGRVLSTLGLRIPAPLDDELLFIPGLLIDDREWNFVSSSSLTIGALYLPKLPPFWTLASITFLVGGSYVFLDWAAYWFCEGSDALAWLELVVTGTTAPDEGGGCWLPTESNRLV